MEVRPSYKKTDLGVIPRDWDIVPMGQVSECLVGLTYSPRDVRDFGTLVLRSSNVQNGKLAFTDNVFVDMDVPTRAITQKNDILICVRNGSRQLIGKCALIDDETAGSAFGAFMSVLRSDSAKFLFFQFQSSVQKRQIDEVMGATINQITNKDMAAFKVIWPPTKTEQEAIAEALSDADALIESLEQLLSKKRNLKQGAMQELLTGKKRLPGFECKRGYKQTEAGVIPEDWESPELGELLKSMQLGGNYKNSERETNWPLIKMGNLGRGNINLNRLEFVHSVQGPSSRDRLEVDDVLLNTRNTLDLVGKVAIWRDELPEAYFNSNIMRMKFDEQRVSSYRFMNYILNTSGCLRGLRSIAIGTTSVAAIYSRDLVRLKIPLPTKAEQVRIAAILSDMDDEIAALEAKLTKARQLKQGMMQELLTGRIRLV